MLLLTSAADTNKREPRRSTPNLSNSAAGARRGLSEAAESRDRLDKDEDRAKSLGVERAPSLVSAGARRLDSVIDRLMKS